MKLIDVNEKLKMSDSCFSFTVLIDAYEARHFKMSLFVDNEKVLFELIKENCMTGRGCFSIDYPILDFNTGIDLINYFGVIPGCKIHRYQLPDTISKILEINNKCSW